MSTGEIFTEHVQLLRDTTLVGRSKNCAMVPICDSACSHPRASLRKWCYHNDVTLLHVPVYGTSLLQLLDRPHVIKSYHAWLRQHDFLYALAGCSKDVSGVDVRRKGVSAAKMMSRMQAMLFVLKSTPAMLFAIKRFRKMLGITNAELAAQKGTGQVSPSQVRFCAHLLQSARNAMTFCAEQYGGSKERVDREARS